jgi:hypothetical protein
MRRLLTSGRSLGAVPADSCRCECEVAHSHQIVNCQGQTEHPIDSRHSAMASLAQSADGLDPAEDLFHPFALTLTDGVPRMPSGALVDDTGLLPREMRGDRCSRISLTNSLRS